jgi:hypothetical protein
LYFKAARAALSPRGIRQRHVPPGPRGPYCRSAIGQRAHASHMGDKMNIIDDATAFLFTI